MSDMLLLLLLFVLLVTDDIVLSDCTVFPVVHMLNLHHIMSTNVARLRGCCSGAVVDDD